MLLILVYGTNVMQYNYIYKYFVNFLHHEIYFYYGYCITFNKFDYICSVNL